MTRLSSFLCICAGVSFLHIGLTACSSSSLSESRTQALQNRQDWMNSRAGAAAERRQIRSDNMDSRTAVAFDAM